MAAPHTYAAWAALLAAFGAGDDTTLEWLAQGQWRPDAGTALRFSQLVNATYAARKQRWLTAYERAAALQPLRSAADLAQQLRQATQNLVPLRRLVSLPALPENLRITLQQDLAAFVDDIRQSLHANIMRHPTERRDDLLLALHAFGPLPAAGALSAALPVAEPAAPVETAPPGRRIIF